MMNHYKIVFDQEISWSEFEVVARKCSEPVQYVNRALRKKVRDFHMQIRNLSRVSILDTEQVLDYSYTDEDLTYMEGFRVQMNNERFGFNVENPSDADYQELAAR
jgi:hypothetical protein